MAEVSARAYNSVWQLRADTWCRLEDAGECLANAAVRGGPMGPLAATVEALPGQLRELERYGAYPGTRVFTSGLHPTVLDKHGTPTPDEAEERIETGRPVVSATFVSPYPPGFPALVPGQVVSTQILSFMRGLDTREIHGYWPQRRYPVYAAKPLEIADLALGR